MFEPGNKYAQEWNLENALPRFEDALKYAEENPDCLCLQDAIRVSAIPNSTFYYLCDTQPVLDRYKKDMNAAIISRVNKAALKGELKETASIFRMKQLGERDKIDIDHTNAGGKFEPPSIKFYE
jgi:hypothetical protein